jgi:hypothetical protein
LFVKGLSSNDIPFKSLVNRLLASEGGLILRVYTLNTNEQLKVSKIIHDDLDALNL